MPADRTNGSVLALVAERPTHGWALASLLKPNAEVGSIWAISRPVVYHCFERLEREEAITATGIERGARGPHRVVYEVTPTGRRDLRTWFATPVERVRDIRSLFLLKVVLAQRAGMEVESLLVAQRSMLLPLVALLESQLDDTGPGASAERTTLSFRLESATSTVRFIDGLLDEPATQAPRRAARR